MIPRHVQIATALLLVGIFAGAFYALRLKRKNEEAVNRIDVSRVGPPVAGTPAPVTLWIAYDEDGVFRQEQASVPLPDDTSGRARQVLHAVISEYVKTPSPHPLAPGTDVRDVYLVNDLAIIDMTAPFSDSHRSGALVEEFTVTSLIATLSANVPQVHRVKFLVEGQERETLAGHADLVSIYDVEQVNHFVKALQ